VGRKRGARNNTGEKGEGKTYGKKAPSASEIAKKGRESEGRGGGAAPDFKGGFFGTSQREYGHKSVPEEIRGGTEREGWSPKQQGSKKEHKRVGMQNGGKTLEKGGRCGKQSQRACGCKGGGLHSKKKALENGNPGCDNGGKGTFVRKKCKGVPAVSGTYFREAGRDPGLANGKNKTPEMVPTATRKEGGGKKLKEKKNRGWRKR